jgi:hypothetical protein
MNEKPIAIRIVQVLLALALLGSLFFAGGRIYRRLPNELLMPPADDPQSQVTIVLNNPAIAGNTKVELYPIDFSAMQREFVTSGWPGRTFEEFLRDRLKALSPTRARFDQSGRAVAQLSAGPWWLRATTTGAGGELTEWRLPLTISQRAITIELSADNAYERTKKF